MPERRVADLLDENAVLTGKLRDRDERIEELTDAIIRIQSVANGGVQVDNDPPLKTILDQCDVLKGVET